MDVSPEIAFREIEPSDPIKSLVLERIDDLEEVHDHLVSCRVILENTTPGRTSGTIWRVHLEMGVPGHNAVVNWKPPRDGQSRELEQAINEAFDVGRRRLKELRRKQIGDVKTHGLPPHARIVKLLTDDTGERYGFLMARDGRQVYFHENALVELDYDELEIGDEVRYAEAGGDEGPQASTVSPMDPDKVGPRQEESVPLESSPGG